MLTKSGISANETITRVAGDKVVDLQNGDADKLQTQ
jgi:hypothetical protein